MAVVDDLGYDEVGWKNPLLKTPTIDALANDGVILERHYAFHVCAPSRSALFTGRIPAHVQQYNFGAIDLEFTLMPQLLKKAGYRTALAGKWGVGDAVLDHLPAMRGFDDSFAMLGFCADHWTHRSPLTGRTTMRMTETNDDWVVDLWEGLEPAKPPCLGSTTRTYPDCDEHEQEHSCPLFNKKAVQYIEEHDPATPLFLYVGWTEAHDPYEDKHPRADPEAVGKGHKSHAPIGYDPLYDAAMSEKDRGFLRLIQRSMVQCVDEGTANITAALKDKGMWETTLMVWTSDNGGQISEASNNAPLRGGKETTFEGGVRVVSFVSGGFLPPSHPASLQAVVSIADWYGTFARLAGVDDYSDPAAVQQGLPDVDALDVWPLLSGQSTEPVRTELLLQYHRYGEDGELVPSVAQGGGGESVAFISGQYKLIGRDPVKGVSPDYIPSRGKDFKSMITRSGWSYRTEAMPNLKIGFNNPDGLAPAGGDSEFMLFDLEADPSETNDLAAELPDVVATLAVRMDELGRGVYQPVPIHERGGGLWCIQDKVEYAARFGEHFGPACVSLGSPQETSFRTCASGRVGWWCNVTKEDAMNGMGMEEVPAVYREMPVDYKYTVPARNNPAAAFGVHHSASTGTLALAQVQQLQRRRRDRAGRQGRLQAAGV
jgi:arylsulfatase A-like enzyme